MRGWSVYVVAVATGLTLGLAWPQAEAQRCFPCYRVPNPKDRNPDRRADRPDTLEPSDGRDSSSRPTVLPGTDGEPSRDFVPKQEIIRSAPGDVAPDEVLPPPSNP
ncbi:MAG: hypothetical protein V4625_04555 [Pseudomonadota bacterium]